MAMPHPPLRTAARPACARAAERWRPRKLAAVPRTPTTLSSTMRPRPRPQRNALRFRPRRIHRPPPRLRSLGVLTRKS
jgi:hypothetical protein